MKKILFPVLFLCTFLLIGEKGIAQADPDTYLSDIKAALAKRSRTYNLVFHGHSVPTGLANTPYVRRLQSYPFLLLGELQEHYPYSIVNIITTSISSENSEQGEKRFKKDVLPHRPDVIFIDYALNDRGIGLEKTKKATEKMIKTALKRHIKVILMTPSPDLDVNITQSGNILEQYSNQLIGLAKKYNIGLANSYEAFVNLAKSGKNLHDYMAQYNHPNQKGHEVIAKEIMKYFK